MNCLLTYIILFLLIILFQLNDDIFSFNKILTSNNIVKTSIKKKKNTCSIPSYVQAQGTYFVKDDNNYQYNHISQKKINNLRHIECSGKQKISIDKYMDKFLTMDYDNAIEKINYDKLENITL